LTLTRRGKVVLALAVIGIALGINVFFHGKWVDCDLRGQVDRCSISKEG
jgi:hypothetical protein